MFTHVSIKKNCGDRLLLARCPAPMSQMILIPESVWGIRWDPLKRCGRGRVLFTGMEMGVMSKMLNTGFVLKIILCCICVLSLF